MEESKDGTIEDTENNSLNERQTVEEDDKIRPQSDEDKSLDSSA